MLVLDRLISYFKSHNKTIYIAENPKHLIGLAEKEKENINNFVSQLLNIKKEGTNQFDIRVYEGYQGFKKAFEFLIEEAKPNNNILAIGFSSPITLSDKLRAFLSDIDRRRIHKKVKLKILFEEGSKIGKDREKDALTEVRYISKGHFSPTGINILNDIVLLELWEEKPFVIMIKSDKMALSFRNYFELLWEMTK